jgi:DNA-binding transcriptional ArsR family regulator
MKLRLLLKSNGKVLFEMPLSTDQWTKKGLERELAFSEPELERFSKLFDALSHGTRLRMMTRLLGDEDLTLGFGEFMRDLGLNPKTVWESTRKLQEGGLVVKSKDGRYRASEHGAAEFLMLSLALRRLFKAVGES